MAICDLRERSGTSARLDAASREHTECAEETQAQRVASSLPARLAFRAQREQLKEGEAEKEKEYSALIWVSRPLTAADVASLQAMKAR